MYVGIICEGATDFAVLSAVCRATLGSRGLVVSLLQPNFDALRRKDPEAHGTGWQGVRAFLGDTRSSLASAPQDVIVVQVDADIRLLDAVRPKLPADESDGLEPLCEHVKSWMSGGVPEPVVIVLPRESTEAWLVAAATNRHDVEGIRDPAEELRAAGLVQEAHGRAEKRSAVYEAMTPALEHLLRDRRKLARVPELERFVGKLQRRAAAVRRGARKKP